MAKTKITISLDERIVKLIDRQRGGEKRSTYINGVMSRHFSTTPQEGGETFVTTLELRKTLKPIYDKLVALEGLDKELEELRGIISTPKKKRK